MGREKRAARKIEAAKTLDVLRERFPACFAPLTQRHRWPLKVGVHIDIQAAVPDLSSVAIRQALGFYTGAAGYLELMTAGRPRIGLDGRPAGPAVSEADAAKAKAILQKHKNTPRKAPQKPVAPPARPRLTIADLKAAAKLKQQAAA
jgi:sRNA-binding protein